MAAKHTHGKKKKKTKTNKNTPPKAASNRKWHQGLFRSLGSVAGGFLGGAPGAALGGNAGDLLARVAGFGSYGPVRSNSLLSGGGPPAFAGVDGVRIAHREFIQDIESSVGFTNTTFAINPGRPGSFPWLSKIAPLFEQYRLRGMIVEFKTTSAVAVGSTNTALGVVVMAAEYDVLEPSFADKRHMEATAFCTSTTPSASVLYAIECAPSETNNPIKYVHMADRPDADLRIEDFCNFQIATVGMQEASVIGELWFTYEVEFLKPILPNIAPIPPPPPPFTSLLGGVRYIERLSDSETEPLGLFLGNTSLAYNPLQPPYQQGQIFMQTYHDRFGTVPITLPDANKIYIDTPGRYILSVTRTSSGTSIGDFSTPVWGGALGPLGSFNYDDTGVPGFFGGPAFHGGTGPRSWTVVYAFTVTGPGGFIELVNNIYSNTVLTKSTYVIAQLASVLPPPASPTQEIENLVRRMLLEHDEATLEAADRMSFTSVKAHTNTPVTRSPAYPKQTSHMN